MTARQLTERAMDKDMGPQAALAWLRAQDLDSLVTSSSVRADIEVVNSKADLFLSFGMTLKKTSEICGVRIRYAIAGTVAVQHGTEVIRRSTSRGERPSREYHRFTASHADISP